MQEERRNHNRSIRRVIEGDGERLSPIIDESHRTIEGGDLDYARYTSQEFFEKERQLLWPRVWQWACREEHVPEPGDYYVYDIDKYSLLVVRNEDGSIRAFRNSCTHRGTQLRPPGSSGSTTAFRCRFHGWKFDLKGRLVDLPCRWDFPHLGEQHNLSEVLCETWGGFVFVNLDINAAPLMDFLSPLQDHFRGNLDLSQRVIAVHLQKELPTNWKPAAEAFLETYHLKETHPQMRYYLDGAKSQYDIFTPNVSRFVNVRGIPSEDAAGLSEDTILRSMPGNFVSALVAPGGTARSTATAIIRERLTNIGGANISTFTTSEILDLFQYFLFPNAFVFGSVAVSPVYRFRPLSLDRTLMDVLLLRLKGVGEKAVEPPGPILFGEDESFKGVENLDPLISLAFDQDTGNMRAQWSGFHTSGKPGETLGIYQETLIRNFHATLDTYLSGAA